MPEIRYIFIEKINDAVDEWRGIGSTGLVVGLGASLPSLDWSALHCLLVKKWGDTDFLKDHLTELAPHLASPSYDFRVFLHRGGGALSGQAPRTIWQQPEFASMTSYVGWPRLWSVGGSQAQSFSKAVQDLVHDIGTSQQIISNWSTRWSELNRAWDQATDFFSIHPKLRKAVGGLYALSGQIEHGTPPGWAPLHAASVQKVAQAALEATDEILIGLHGEQDGRATAVKDELHKIVVDPLGASVWQGFKNAVDTLKS